MAVTALVANIALRAEVANAAAFLAVTGGAGVLWQSTPLRSTRATQAATVVAVGAAAGLVFRASTWLTALNSLSALAALGVLAVLAGPHPLRFSGPSLLATLQRVGGAFYGPKIVFDAAKTSAGRVSRLVPLVRGAIVAAVPVIVLGALLASADAVFADAISTDFDPSGFLEHALLTTALLVALAALVAYAATSKDLVHRELRPLGSVESLVVLGSIAAVFALFAATQLASALGQTDGILSSQGISHADYARSGYFQLLWVAALTALLLASVRLLARRGTGMQVRAQLALSALVALLTCVIVASAIVRLDLYTDAFGQTTLRWYSGAFAWMLGIGFALTAVAGLRETSRWLPISLVSLTAATLLVVNVLNAEARIAEHNLDRAGTGIDLDAAYLLRLSADAWPVLLDHRDQVIDALDDNRIDATPQERFDRACDKADESNGYGPFGFNLAIARLDCAAA